MARISETSTISPHLRQPVTQASPFSGYHVLSFGELLWDLFPDRPRLGGAAANVAVHVARLGNHSYLASRVGQDELGREARRLLEEEGVDTSDVGQDPSSPTGCVEITLKGGEPQFRIAESAAWDRIALPALPNLPSQGLSAVVFGTLAQRHPLTRGVLCEFLDGLDPGVLRICDLNLRPPFVNDQVVHGALARAQVLKLNLAEAEQLTELFPAQSLEALCFAYPKVDLIALTRGALGATFITRTKSLDIPASPLLEPDGDAVGAGDAFTAALTNGLLRGVSLDLAGEQASLYAAQVCSVRGALGRIGSDPAHQKS